MSAFRIRTHMQWSGSATRVWPTRVAGAVIVFLAVFLAIVLGRNAEGPSHSEATGCAPDTIRLVAAHPDSGRECSEVARGTYSSPYSPFGR